MINQAVINLIVYVDVLIIVNFIVTYFLLVASAVFSGYTYSRTRVFISAVLGALACLYIFVPNDSLFTDISVKTLSLAVCSIVAFWKGKLKNYLLHTICFVVLNVLITGVVLSIAEKSRIIYQNNMFWYIDINPVVLVTASVFIYITAVLLSSARESIGAAAVLMADIFFDNFKFENITAFYDSGLKIKDVVSNKDIVLVSYEKTKEKMPETVSNDIKDFFREKYTDIKTAFVPVFFNTISGSGMIPAVRAEKIEIKNREIKNVLVAFVQDDFSENVTMIYGTGIKKQI